MGHEGEVASEYSRGEGYAIATWRNVLLMLWTGEITISTLDASERAGMTIQRRYPWQVALSVSAATVRIPDQTVRTHAAKLIKAREDHVRMTVTVIEGESFMHSAGRMVITAMTTLSRSKTKPVIIRSTDLAVPLIQPHVHPAATLSQVENVVRTFRG